MGFRVGQRVVVVRSARAEFIGQVTTILAGPLVAHAPSRTGHIQPGETIYQLDLPALTGWRYVAAKAADIRPVDDGCEAIAWTAELLKLCGTKQKASAAE